MKIELAGFQTVVRKGIIVSVGITTPIDQQLDVAKVQESITVAGQSPTVDTTSANVSTTLNQQLLQSTPGGRDIWSIAEYKIPGLVTNRPDTGGNQGGLQAGMVAAGTSNGQNTQFLNGINVGDPAAIGYTQFYYDYDAFDEINVSVGAQDLSVPSGGVFLNMVTKSGTDQFHGKGEPLLAGPPDAGHEHRLDAREPGAVADGRQRATSCRTPTSRSAGRSSRTSCGSSASFRDWRVHVNVPGFPRDRADQHHLGARATSRTR